MQKVCIIGLGPMGKRHIEALRSMDDMNIFAVIDMNEKTLHSVGEEYSIAFDRRFDSIEKIKDKHNIDIVVIATNGPSHYSIFKEVVRHGIKKVFCEKPIATSLKHAYEMQEIAQSSGIKLVVNHARRWCDDYIQLKEKLLQKCIGNVESYMFSMGGGQMGCNATHFIDLISFLSNQTVQSVVGFIHDENVPNPRGIQFKDPGGYAILHLLDNTRVFFEMTEDIGIPPIMIINGSHGRIVIEETKRLYQIERREEQSWSMPLTRYGIPLSNRMTIPFEHLDIVALTRKAYKFFNSKNQDHFSITHAIHALETVIAIHASSMQSNSVYHMPVIEQSVRNKLFTFT